MKYVKALPSVAILSAANVLRKVRAFLLSVPAVVTDSIVVITIAIAARDVGRNRVRAFCGLPELPRRSSASSSLNSVQNFVIQKMRDRPPRYDESPPQMPPCYDEIVPSSSGHPVTECGPATLPLYEQIYPGTSRGESSNAAAAAVVRSVPQANEPTAVGTRPAWCPMRGRPREQRRSGNDTNNAPCSCAKESTSDTVRRATPALTSLHQDESFAMEFMVAAQIALGAALLLAVSALSFLIWKMCFR
ncbi:hypothetical protein J437_LFUL012158 [Ladona fulva]|uniref:Uncharacterized protein n=1 Tax=Ladona fulva TaxID=123851 RepID=A0A8K0KHR3_LADFU|nr:hypothetical protein J437_LFUL012158 [Ladona fulva]